MFPAGDAGPCPGVDETCNGIDDDCDSIVDEDDVCAPCVPGTYDGHRYLFCLERLRWSDARAACVARGYDDLVVIFDGAENSYVSTQTQGLVVSETWWLGWSGEVPISSECTCGSACLGFMAGGWVDGNELSYSDWGIAQPCKSQPACITMDHTRSGWGIWNCVTQLLYYVCETTD